MNLTGYTQEEVAGASVVPLLFEGHAERRDLRRLDLCLAGRKSFQGELRAKGKTDGHFLWLQLSLTPYQEEAGQDLGHIYVISDVTEKKQSEQLIRQNETRLKEAQKAAHIGSFEIDYQSNAWSCTEEMYQVLGLPNGFELTLEQFASLIQPEFRDQVMNLFEVVRRKGGVFDMDYKITRPVDGHEVWVHGMGKVQYNELGKPLAMFGTIQEIEERKRAEEELRQNKDLFQTVFENATDAIFLVDAERDYPVDCNARAIEVFEAQSKASLLAFKSFDLLKKSLSEQEVSYIEEQLQKRQVLSFGKRI
ncbi:MAG: PAS domain S-box protein [Cytophagales bacterium]|nr:PAS domain S-box protein [Cytophagales bacterium]